MRMFVAVNGWSWRAQPDIDDAEATVLAVAAGDMGEAAVAEWLRQFLVAPSDT
jgi:prophage maintenance system killer protein